MYVSMFKESANYSNKQYHGSGNFIFTNLSRTNHRNLDLY